MRSAKLVAAAQPIVRCGEVVGIGRRREVSERRMRALGIEVDDPGSNLGAGIVEIEEERLVEKLGAHAAVEAFDEAILHRPSGREEVPVDGVVMTPGEHGVAGVFRAVVADDHAWLAMALYDGRQFARHAPARDRSVRDRTEALLRHVVVDVEDAEAAPVRELVVEEVRGPARIRLHLDQDRRTRSNGLAAGAALAHREPFFTIEPMDAIDARRLTLAPEQDEQPAISKAAPLVGEIAQPSGQPISKHRRSLVQTVDDAAQGDTSTYRSCAVSAADGGRRALASTAWYCNGSKMARRDHCRFGGPCRNRKP